MENGCPDIIELERFALNDIDPATHTSIDQHLLTCAECSQLLSDLRENLSIASNIRRGNHRAEPIFEEEPKTIGSFKVIRKIGQGGMGAVYEVEQENPRRVVALKMIRPGLVSRSAMARFRHEAQILGRLHHPGIAQIYEAGTYDSPRGPQPFFVLELVRGLPLRRFADENQLSVDARLELLAKICDAVQHAHQRGVLHRDLKPDNILVECEERSGFRIQGTARENQESAVFSLNPEPRTLNPKAAQPKILDFGVGRVIDPDAQYTTMHTSAGQIVGTVAYMSPEQAAGNPGEIDTRSDVYALGVIGYQLLSGQMPYKLSQASVAESVRTIVQDDPTPLQTIDRSFRGDVSTIIGKALSKEKVRRYPSAAEMAADIRRFLHDEPISAHPPSAMYQLGKFARRNKGLVGGVIAAFIVLIGGVIGTSVGLVRAERSRNAAETARQEADRSAEAARASAAEAKKEAARQVAVTDFLIDMLAAASPGNLSSMQTAKGRDVTLFAALNEASKKVNGGSLQDQPELELAVRNIICATYQELGEYEDAAAHAEQMIALAKRLNGAEHASVANAINSLSVIRKNHGKPKAARLLAEEALAMYRKIDDPQKPSSGLSAAMNNYAMILQDDGDLKQAEALYREAMEARLKNPGRQSRDYTVVANNLASVLNELGRTKEAEALYRESIEINKKLFNGQHPDLAKSTANFALLLMRAGKMDEAETALNEALALHIKLFGETHPGVAAIYNNLARLMQVQRKLDEAEKYYIKAAEVFEKGGGNEVQLATLKNNLGTLLNARNKLEESERVFREVLELRTRLLGADHVDTANTLHNLGYVLDERKQHTQAEEMYRSALATKIARSGDDSETVATTRMQLGNCLLQQNRFEEAEKELLLSMRFFEPRLAERDRVAVGGARYLARLYKTWNKPQEEAKWRARLPATRASTTQSTQATTAPSN